MAVDSLTALVSLFQLADGVFPAGGFAHSFGLETYAQRGDVHDGRGVEAFVRAQLSGSSGPADAVAAAAASRRATVCDLAGCVAIDERLDAMRIVPEVRAASRQMGRQTARVAAALDDADTFVHRLFEAIENGVTPGHHAVVFGAVTGRRGAAPERAAAALLYSTASLLVNSALRLVRLGQLDGQRILSGLTPLIVELARRAAERDPDEMWSFAPGLELAALAHADLEMRLFRS